MPLYPPSKLDGHQVLQHSFDDATQTLRTTATATIVTPPDIEVNIDHVNDSIKIGDGTDLMAVNPDGSINTVTSGPGTPTIANVSMAVAGTEYSYAFPANTKKFTIQSRNDGKLKIAFTAGQSATQYISISAGAAYSEESVKLVSVTLYFQSSKNADTLEILSWA